MSLGGLEAIQVELSCFVFYTPLIMPAKRLHFYKHFVSNRFCEKKTFRYLIGKFERLRWLVVPLWWASAVERPDATKSNESYISVLGYEQHQR